MNIKLIIILFLLLIFRVLSKECCHFGNLILSSGYCKEKNLKYIRIGNSTSSPCEKSSETLSWGYQEMFENSSFIWYECQLYDKDEVYYQVGSCGHYGFIKKENQISFSNYEQFFSVLSCIKENKSSKNSYGYVISSSLKSLESAIYSYKNVCYQTGAKHYLFDIWEYGNDINCIQTLSNSSSSSLISKSCSCAQEYIKINGTCKTSYPYSSLTSSNLSLGKIDPICNGYRCHMNRRHLNNNSNRLKWMIPTIIFSTIGGLLLIAGLIYLIRRSRDNDFNSPLLG